MDRLMYIAVGTGLGLLRVCDVPTGLMISQLFLILVTLPSDR